MNVRLAVPADIEHLITFNAAMALETEGKTLSPEKLRPGVSAVLGDAQKGFYIVAEDEGSIVGGLMVTFEWSDWRNAWFWWIQSVYVTAETRGQGTLQEDVRCRSFARGRSRQRLRISVIRRKGKCRRSSCVRKVWDASVRLSYVRS